MIFNIHSGTGEIRRKLANIIDILERNGYTVVTHSTKCKGDATKIVKRRAKNFDLVLSCGGDGTLNETVTGMRESGVRTPIAYVPSGSTNDFASSLNLPKGIMKTAEVAATGKPFSCDVGEMNGKTFVYAAAFGILSDIPYRTRQWSKNILGHAAYMLESVKEFATAPFGFYPSFNLKVSVNGEELEDNYVYGMITNTSSIGGVKDVTGRNVELDDGLLEVTLVKRPKLAIWFIEVMANLTHLIKKSKYVYTCKAESIKIQSDKPLSWTLDGEYGGEWNEIEIHCVKKAVDIMVRPD